MLKLVGRASVVGATVAVPGLEPLRQELIALVPTVVAFDARIKEADPDFGPVIEKVAETVFRALPELEAKLIADQVGRITDLSGLRRESQLKLLIASLIQIFMGSDIYKCLIEPKFEVTNETVNPHGKPDAGEDQELESRDASASTAPEPGDPEDDDGMTNRITLSVLAGAHSGLQRSFNGGASIHIGRLPPQDSSLTYLSFPKDPYASRKHCVLECHPPRWKAVNLSRKGIIVNGEKELGEHWLQNGDRLRVGQSILAVAMDETREPGPTRAVACCSVCGRRILLRSSPRSIEIVCLECLGQEAYFAQPFPKTTILGQIGRGGMGEVLLGRQTEQDELVAIKTFISDPARADDGQNINAFLREFQVGSQIRHPHAARVYASGIVSEHNLYYFLMEYVNGPDVSRAISGRGRAFSIARAIEILRQVMQAVQAAHAQGLVHRDIKPENIILGGDEAVLEAKLTDFGLMKDFVNVGMSFITQPGDGKGTPGFLPPEQLEDPRHVGPAADVYALGATLQYMMTGKPPFRLDTAYFANIILNPKPIPLRSVLPKAPLELERVILKCLAKKPEDRYQSVAELDAELLAILKE